jgi:uncharacterized membrane protein YiaA
MSKYIIAFIPVLYGILILKGIHIHRLNGSGWGWISVGIFFLLIGLFSDYYISQHPEYQLEEKELLSLIDIVCIGIFWLGVVLMSLYMFKIILNDFAMLVATLTFMFCGGRQLKKSNKFNEGG